MKIIGYEYQSVNTLGICFLHEELVYIQSSDCYDFRAGAAGNRGTNGIVYNVGRNGNYWSSTPNGANAYNLNINSSGVNPSNSNNRSNGFLVRCVAELLSDL